MRVNILCCHLYTFYYQSIFRVITVWISYGLVLVRLFPCVLHPLFLFCLVQFESRLEFRFTFAVI